MHRKMIFGGQYYADLLAKNIVSHKIFLICGESAKNMCNKFCDGKPWLYLPAYDEPGNYRYPVRDAEVIIYDTGYCEKEYLNALAFYLFDEKAKSVRCVLPDYSSILFNN